MLPTLLTLFEAEQVAGQPLAWHRHGSDWRSRPGPRLFKIGRGLRVLAVELERWCVDAGIKVGTIAVHDPAVPDGLDASGLPAVLTDRQAQGLLRMSDPELRKRRRTGHCPPWTKAGRCVAWRRDDVLAWLELQARQVERVDPVQSAAP